MSNRLTHYFTTPQKSRGLKKRSEDPVSASRKPNAMSISIQVASSMLLSNGSKSILQYPLVYSTRAEYPIKKLSGCFFANSAT